nr:chromatin assembly factor 1 subunit A-B [Danaus plexippus plexippus]
MNKMRKHKIKHEIEASSSNIKEEHDLAYYIHDRVELMHQVFSMIKPKELKAMAPSCVQHISIDNLQELCTEEVEAAENTLKQLEGRDPDYQQLAIKGLIRSAKRVLTCTRDETKLANIKNSIEIFEKFLEDFEREHRSKQNNTYISLGLVETSLDLAGDRVSEQQRRECCCIINTTLENSIKIFTDYGYFLCLDTEPDRNHSSDEVEIKEEPPEVLEISSDEEKPKVEELQKIVNSVPGKQQTNPPVQPSTSSENTEMRSQTVTKVVNDLIITIPAKPTKKIKLNRNISLKNSGASGSEVRDGVRTQDKETKPDKKEKDKPRKKKTKKKIKDGSDHDEITLQLSDTEKMDLLEDLDRKNFDNVTSSNDSCTSDEADAPASGSLNSQNNEVPQIDVNQENKADESSKDIENIANKDGGVFDVTGDSDRSNHRGDKKENETEAENSNNKDTDIVNEALADTQDGSRTKEQIEDGEITSNKDLSDGEISEGERDVVCISDDDTEIHKKKKKDKKSKKEKSDFHESSDQNFFKEDNAQDIYEVLELSDSDYDVDIEVSQEPTAEEMKALSAKIDERTKEEEMNISWRDRYLDSKKVKKVLTTANLLNAMRKKNRELKSKLEMKPQKEQEVQRELNIEGTVDEFNTLEGSTKYVDPIKEKDLTKEMKKDAKQLIKMYKMLMKYNDINKQKDKKKKKKSKKEKEKKMPDDT